MIIIVFDANGNGKVQQKDKEFVRKAALNLVHHVGYNIIVEAPLNENRLKKLASFLREEWGKSEATRRPLHLERARGNCHGKNAHGKNAKARVLLVPLRAPWKDVLAIEDAVEQTPTMLKIENGTPRCITTHFVS